MMHYQVLKGLFIVTQVLFVTNAIGIDGKLGFEDSHLSTSTLRTENRGVFTPFKYSKTIKTSNDDFDNVGVVCTSGSCNTMHVSSNNTGDSIQTDVFVHVHTKVDFGHNKTEPIGDTPDIPIVIGYGGSQLDYTVDENNNRPSDFLEPTTSSRVHSINNLFDNLDPSAKFNGDFYRNKPLRVDTVGFISKPNEKSDLATITDFYPVERDPQLNININPYSLGLNNDKNKANGIDLKIPYFNPTYHSHYYSENPPPQYLWSSKKTNGFNPVEFKTIKSTWTPTVFNRKVVPIPHRHTESTGEVKCTCKEEHSGSNTGLKWYPSENREISSINNAGFQINDKLAPLN